MHFCLRLVIWFINFERDWSYVIHFQHFIVIVVDHLDDDLGLVLGRVKGQAPPHIMPFAMCAPPVPMMKRGTCQHSYTEIFLITLILLSVKISGL